DVPQNYPAFAGWEFLPTDPTPVYTPKTNRYMVVAYSCNQTLEYAQEAFLHQVGDAMTTGKNVVTPPGYPTGVVRPFCANGCIVISHSTGALVVNSALGRAYNNDFGTGGKDIAAKMAAHVAFDGATSGSRLASIAVAIGVVGAPVAGAFRVIC